MGDKINKEFEEFQKQLEIKNKRLKPMAHFEPDEKLDEVMNELKGKQVNL